jgi:hypothetical protein
MIFCWSSLKNLLPFQYFCLCSLMDVWSEGSDSSTEVSTLVSWDNHSRVCVLFVMSPKLFLSSFHAFLLHFSHFQGKQGRYVDYLYGNHRWHLTFTGDRGSTVVKVCATNLKVAGSIPDGVVGFFRWHNPSDRTMALGSTQPLTEMSTRSISWG